MSAIPPDNKRPLPRSNGLPPPGRPPIRSISSSINQPAQRPIRQISFDSLGSRSSESAAKRPRIDHETFQQGGGRGRQQLDISTADTGSRISSIEQKTPYKLPPFPSRPGAHIERTRSPIQHVLPREPVSAKPYVLELPKNAPKYANKQPADFFPWTGSKPEDTLNETTIKNGYFDKAATAQAESSSARPAIWPNIKHKSGLQLLCSLYSTTIEQRQKFGAVSTASTFKPPPRATLTEPKRELWLKDLADPEISLRRLSRTIPHGIRGKTLLDQCMAKKIPLERALWLVKCVGANEIRAFKRKGPSILASGSEAKWIREWTSNMTEFLDALIDSCGSADWKKNVDYGLRLMAYIYSESLADKDYFLEWIVRSLHSASEEKLPIWIMITRMYWNELIQCRRFGKSLAIALCEQATRLHGHVVDANELLWESLSTLIKTYLDAKPDCFIFPASWETYSRIIKTICSDSQETFVYIQDRNNQLASYAIMDNCKDARQAVVEIIDSRIASVDVKTTSRRCLAACPDRYMLLSTISQHATTIYRSGLSHLYLNLRLLRRWTKTVFDIEPLFYLFIRSCSTRQDLDKAKLFRLVSELTKSKHLSVPRYLQWIMAQGDPVTLERELLFSIPLQGLPDHARNLCQMVLKCQLPEQSSVEKVKALMSDFLFTESDSKDQFGHDLLSSLRLPEQYDVAHWLRTKLFTYVNDDNTLDSVDDFSTLCTSLIAMDAYPVLSDVLAVYSEVAEVDLLHLVLDVVNNNFDCLESIGATEDVCDNILQRMEEVPGRSPDQKPLISSLVDLLKRMPRRTNTLAVLQKELSFCEPKSAIAACSPVSDAMGDSQDDITFVEEIELLFGNGTSMDRPLLTKIFTDIVKRLEASWVDDIPASINLAELLLRLRSFNREIFATLMPTWIGTILNSKKEVKTLLAILICAGVLDMKDLFQRLITQTSDTMNMSSATLQELLQLTLEKTNLPKPYLLKIELDQLVDSSPEILAQFINLVWERCGGISTLAMSGFRELAMKMAIQSNTLAQTLGPVKLDLLSNKALDIPRQVSFMSIWPGALCYFNASLCAWKLEAGLKEYPTMDLSKLPRDIFQAVVAMNDCRRAPLQLLFGILPSATVNETHRLLMFTLLDKTLMGTLDSKEAILNLLAIAVNRMAPQDLVSFITMLSNQISTMAKTILSSSRTEVVEPSGSHEHLRLLLRMLAIHSSGFDQSSVSSTTVTNLALSLSGLYLHSEIIDADFKTALLNVLTIVSDTLRDDTRLQIMHTLQQHQITNPTLLFLFGPHPSRTRSSMLKLMTFQADSNISTAQSSNPTTINSSGKSIEETQPITSTPFALHPWEMVQDATPVIGENDTSLSLALFGARRAVL